MADPAVEENDGATRRDFLDLVAISTVAVGGAALVWPLVDSLNPSADVLALASIEFDLSSLEPGMSVTVKWRGKPVFVRYRTPEEIAEAEAVADGDMIDPEADADRVIKPEYLVMVGVCTHLGCVPLGNKAGEEKGEYGGWFCPCHGSHYDTSGRIRKGPAPRNLEVPEYQFLDDSTVRIG